MGTPVTQLTPVTMPMLGLTMEEGTVAEWLKSEGDVVARDEPLLMVEMDKGTMEVPSPASGVLRRIVVQPGVTVPVKTLIAEIGQPGEASFSAPIAAVQPASNGEPLRVFASPRARRRARTLDLDLRGISGSGPNGRIVEADVLAARGEGTGAAAAITELSAAVQPLSRLRKLTAEHMAASAQATARVTLFLDADFSEAVRFRDQLQPEFARLGVPKLPWDALIAKAAGLALLEHPDMLAQWVDGQDLRNFDAAHVGVAMALDPAGLVVPVLRDAGSRSLRELASDLLALAEKAHSGRLSPREMQGGTFTVTNLGRYRIDGFTPIVNTPETAILGIGRIAPKAVVIDGRVEARTMCTLSLSFDHRVVDGAPAAAFLARLAELLERPYALLGV